MKRIWTVASLVLTGAMACSFAAAANGVVGAAGAEGAGERNVGGSCGFVMKEQTAAHVKKSAKAKPAPDKKKFRYLDMVEKKRPASIRNAVIVYDYAPIKKKAGGVRDATSVSECLQRPSA
jgi:predicted ribonuclease toxin of YeeF-YezG toxin-antitoxin module